MNSLWVSVVSALGLLSLFVGERLIAAGTGRTVASGVGVLLVALALGIRLARWLKASGERRRVEGAALLPQALGAVALALYAVRALQPGLAEDAPRLAGVLAVLWPSLLAFSLVPLLLVELSAASMARAPVVEAGRVRDALRSGLGLSSALVFCFSAVYVATERDVVSDFSYFRTAKPGEATQKLAAALTEPLEVTLFFPASSDVRGQVHGYFTELATHAPQLKVSLVDQAVEPRRAKELGVLTNGSVVLASGEKKETLQLGVELERARSGLKALDRDVHKRLWSLSRSRRTVYFTQGHDERTERSTAEDPRPPLRLFRELLKQQNLELRQLGAAEGLGADVPQDAAAVLVMGPRRAFLPEELASLQRYFDGGGRLWLALDGDAAEAAGPLLAPLGLKLGAHPLANQEIFFRRNMQASDRLNLGTTSYSSHAAISSLARAGAAAPAAFLDARAIEEAGPRAPNLGVDAVVRAHAETFADVDGDFTFTGGTEQKRPWALVMAVQGTPVGEAQKVPRALVMGDVDALTDPILPNLGNAYLATDVSRWLMGEEQFTGAVESEEDVAIQHTGDQDKVWFYGSVFLMPTLVMVAGVVATRRRRPAKTPAPKQEVKA